MSEHELVKMKSQREIFDENYLVERKYENWQEYLLKKGKINESDKQDQTLAT